MQLYNIPRQTMDRISYVFLFGADDLKLKVSKRTRVYSRIAVNYSGFREIDKNSTAYGLICGTAAIGSSLQCYLR